MAKTITVKSLSTGKPSLKVQQRKNGNYNEYQEFLYNRTLFGLSVYSKEEMQMMHYDKKKRIIKVHKRAQTLINLWKQRVVNVLSNYVFQEIFPDSPITKELINSYNITDELYVNKMSFKSLHIKKEEVITKFIKEGILPKNFNELKQVEDANRISNERKLDSSVKPGERTGGRALEVSSKAR